MDSYEKNTHKLKNLWRDDDSRQGAKIEILRAIGSSSDLSVKTALEVLEELDRQLLPEKEEDAVQKNRGL